MYQRIEELSKEMVLTGRYIQLVSMLDSNKFLTEKEVKFYLNEYYPIEELKQMIEDKNKSIFLGYAEDQPVSLLTMEWDFEKKICTIYSLDVVYEYQNKGVGTFMMCYIIKLLKKYEITKIYIGFHVENKRVSDLYYKMGYIEENRKIQNYDDEKDHEISNGYFIVDDFIENMKKLNNFEKSYQFIENLN
jgi:ribosomal protein S18 acetylase RimI-like enzyme